MTRFDNLTQRAVFAAALLLAAVALTAAIPGAAAASEGGYDETNCIFYYHFGR